jgi:hypothetical protein
MPKPMLRALCLVAAACAASVAITACKAKTEVTADTPEATATVESIGEEDAIITEQHDDATIVWNVSPEGQVKALVKTPDGKVIDKDVSGTVTWKGSAPDAAPIVLPLAFDAKAGMLVGTVPRLDGELTELKYDLKVQGKPLVGALHVPAGGTKELVLHAKASADIKIPEGKVGPNGGVIQVVGSDRIELVAEKATGKVRVYVLDADFNPVKVEDRTIRLAIGGEAPETIVLVPEPGGLYFSGKLRAAVDPVRVTVAVARPRVRTHVCIVGYSPGAVLVVGARAPRVRMVVASGWSTGADVDVRVAAPSVLVVAEPPRPRVGVRVDIRAPAPPKPPKIRVGAGVSVKAGAGVKIR